MLKKTGTKSKEQRPRVYRKKKQHKTDHKRVRRKRVEGCALSELNMDEDLVNN